MNPSYDYQIFISYSSKDKDWAIKLYDDLKAKNLKPFLDRARIEPGKRWEAQLVNSIKQSQHFLVLWSNNAKNSDWVTKELGYFNAFTDVELTDKIFFNRRLIFLLFEGANTAYSSYHMINDLEETNSYLNGLEMLDENLWVKVLNKIEYCINKDDPSIPVTLAILTTSKDRIHQLDSTKRLPLCDSLDTFLSHFEINNKDDLLNYYGDDRSQWCPFKSDITILSILENIKNELNHVNLDIKFRWEPISNEFWESDIDIVQKEINKLSKNLSVIVVDPISLYDEEVKERFNLLRSCLENTKASFLILPPFSISKNHIHLRNLIKNMAKGIFDRYYEPHLHIDRPTANCNFYIWDIMDIKRLLIKSLTPHLRESKRNIVSPFIKTGS